MLAAAVLFSVLGTAFAQSSEATVAASAAASGASAASTGTLSVDSNLPTTPMLTVEGYTIPYVPSFRANPAALLRTLTPAPSRRSPRENLAQRPSPSKPPTLPDTSQRQSPVPPPFLPSP